MKWQNIIQKEIVAINLEETKHSVTFGDLNFHKI